MRPNGRLLHLTTRLDATERSRDAMNESFLENRYARYHQGARAFIAPWNSLSGSSRRSRRSAGPSEPTVPTTAPYKEEAPTAFKESDQWQPAKPGDQTSRGNWWEIFGGPELNKLEEQIAGSNQNLKVAEARFREARAAIRFNRASQFPTISTAPSGSYVKNSDYSPNLPSKIQQSSKGEFVLPFDLSLRAGFLGPRAAQRCCRAGRSASDRRRLRDRKAQPRGGTRPGLFRIAERRRAETTSQRYGKAYTDNLQLTVNRFKGRVAPKADVAQAQTQLDTTRVQDTDVTVQQAQFEHAIAILIGKPPPNSTSQQRRSITNLLALRLDSLPNYCSDAQT
jgi:outer membrane protein TolC